MFSTVIKKLIAFFYQEFGHAVMLKDMTVHHDVGSYSFFIEFMLNNCFLIIFDAMYLFC